MHDDDDLVNNDINYGSLSCSNPFIRRQQSNPDMQVEKLDESIEGEELS